MAGEGVGLLFSVPRHWRLAHLCTACSVLAATSGLQGGWENASLCLQIFTRISVVFFAFVPAICLCFLRLFLCCFIFLFLLLKEEQAFLCLTCSIFPGAWHRQEAWFQSHLIASKFRKPSLQMFLCCSLWKINPDWRWRPLIWRGTDCTHSAVSLPSRGNQSICKRLLQYSHTCASGLRQKWKIKILKSDNHKVPLLFFCCRTCSDLLLKN